MIWKSLLISERANVRFVRLFKKKKIKIGKDMNYTSNTCFAVVKLLGIFRWFTSFVPLLVIHICIKVCILYVYLYTTETNV